MNAILTDPVDVLAIGAHPDDVELGCGGMLAKLSQQGKRVIVLDLTRGEMGSRGDADLREQEAAEAARILGVHCRDNAQLPDGGLANTTEQQRVIIPFIRKYRPRAILTLMAPDRHPDHGAAHALGRDANYYAGLQRIDTGQEPYRAPHIYYFHPYTEFAGAPPCVFDISEVFEKKINALKAYASQFHNPDFQGAPTFISTQEFWDGIETRARFWGGRIHVEFGEPLYADAPLPLSTLPGL